ncbi:FAD-dependent oxidoreductase [Streptomyces sp. NPDC006553]|uniref:FAD-dependent oxidoreductase n=1 Tax=Streptomyces sp. NPDC006553 TaxID=3157180 RepID=UPI0033B46A03
MAVIGSGVVGLGAAWELVRTGHTVVVLEADRLAGGVTGHTTGKPTALHAAVYDTLRNVHGRRTPPAFTRPPRVPRCGTSSRPPRSSASTADWRGAPPSPTASSLGASSDCAQRPTRRGQSASVLRSSPGPGCLSP